MILNNTSGKQLILLLCLRHHLGPRFSSIVLDENVGLPYGTGPIITAVIGGHSSISRYYNGIGIEQKKFIVNSNIWKRINFDTKPVIGDDKIRDAILHSLLTCLAQESDRNKILHNKWLAIIEKYVSDAYIYNRYRISMLQSNVSYDNINEGFIKRDQSLLDNMLSGNHPTFDWDEISHDLSVHLEEVLCGSITVYKEQRGINALRVKCFILDTSNLDLESYPVMNPVKFKGSGKKQTIGPNTHLQVTRSEQLFDEGIFDNIEVVLVVSERRVHFACFEDGLSKIADKFIEKRLNIKTTINEVILEGFDKVNARDKAQTKVDVNGTSTARYTNNYGSADRSQSRPPTTPEHLAVCGDRNVKLVKVNDAEDPKSIDTMGIASIYHKILMAVFAQEWIPKKHRWYDNREQQNKGCRKARVSHQSPLYCRNEFGFPYPLGNSTPLVSSGSIDELVTNIFELNSRRVLEEMLLLFFGPLPFSHLGVIQHRNEKYMFDKYLPNNPEIHQSRVLPKGSLGVQLEKPLHDDGNGLLSSSMWRCLSEDTNNPVELEFITTVGSWKIISTSRRFCIFDGLIPHRTKAISNIVRSNQIRMHHSCYIKPRHEHFGLVMCSEQYRDLYKLVD